MSATSDPKVHDDLYSRALYHRCKINVTFLIHKLINVSSSVFVSHIKTYSTACLTLNHFTGMFKGGLGAQNKKYQIFLKQYERTCL